MVPRIYGACLTLLATNCLASVARIGCIFNGIIFFALVTTAGISGLTIMVRRIRMSSRP